MYNIYTSNKHHLHAKNANLSYFQKSTFFADIKNFNCLPTNMTVLKNGKAKVKAAVRKCLKTHSCYTVDEYFMYKDDLQYCFFKMFVLFCTV